jgi:hypothetical protein
MKAVFTAKQLAQLKIKTRVRAGADSNREECKK